MRVLRAGLFAVVVLGAEACTPGAPPITPCTSNEACAEAGVGDFCQFRVGDCAGDSGMCVNRPSRCVATPRTTCGCNGGVFTGGCAAALEGVSVQRYADEPNGQCP